MCFNHQFIIGWKIRRLAVVQISLGRHHLWLPLQAPNLQLADPCHHQVDPCVLNELEYQVHTHCLAYPCHLRGCPKELLYVLVVAHHLGGLLSYVDLLFGEVTLPARKRREAFL